MSRWKSLKPKQPEIGKLSIFDQKKSVKEQIRTQRGIESSYANADTRWKMAAKDALFYVAKNYQDFTTDMIMEYLAKTGVHTGEPRALGAIIQGGARSGMIQKTGQYKESYRRHGAPIPIWASNIYDKDKRRQK